jgi:hypothetical protein
MLQDLLTTQSTKPQALTSLRGVGSTTKPLQNENFEHHS